MKTCTAIFKPLNQFEGSLEIHLFAGAQCIDVEPLGKMNKSEAIAYCQRWQYVLKEQFEYAKAA